MEKKEQKEKKVYKRYQYLSKDGVKWTEWFIWHSDDRSPKQPNKLLNEYKEE